MNRPAPALLATLAPLALLVLAGPAAAAQTAADPQSAVERWRDVHGGSWTAEFDARTGYVSSLYGGHTEASLSLRDDRGALERAREIVVATAHLTGVSPATLVDEGAVYLPLSHAGSSDKYTASFRQRIAGVPVVGAGVQVLMDLQGRALSVDSSAVPGAEFAATTPTQDPARVRARALEAFRRIAGVEGTLAGESRVVLDSVAGPGLLRAALAWEVDVFGEIPGAAPRGLTLRISDADLSLTSQVELVHTCDVTGTVFTRLTPGTLPDLPGNPTVQAPLAHVVVQTPQGSATTDINGNFNIVGATAPLSGSVSYDGPFTTPVNSAAATYSLPITLASPSGNSVVMNSPASAVYTAEANSTYWIGRLRDWIRAVNPLDSKADFDATSNVNLAQTCNAYYAGTSVNFFSAGGGCVNTSYSTVIAHEMGHWLNDRYSSGNGGDGFGEGNADTWATYLTDQPVVGEQFAGGGAIRTGLNNRPFCGDSNGGCYGEVHADGEVLMGALWKLRARLKNSLGAGAGSLTSDLLFNSWMNAYNDGQIKTIVRTHWLVLDDDDGDINNGTPHFNDIDLGFRDQGFPAYPVLPVSLTGVTQLPGTTNEAGPYVVTVQASANVAPPLIGPQLFWRVDGGPYTAINMTPLGGNQFSAAIPGHPSPAKIEYHLRATDSLGSVGISPSGAPTTTYRFVIGEERVYYADHFDNFTGWQAGATVGANEWQFQLPAGFGGDPAAPRTGTRCWGTDLSPTGDGLYSASTSTFLQSPYIDLSACPNPRLRFQRWLTVERAPFDVARVLVNGQVIWQNSSAADTLDVGWGEVEYDLTAAAAGNPFTRIRFELASDGQIQKGGWNVDDVEIVSLAAVGQGCLDPLAYCAGKLTSQGSLPNVGTTGAPSLALQNFVLELREAVANRPGLLLVSTSGPAATPFSGGTLCLQPPVTRYGSFLTDLFSYAAVPVTVTPGMVGITWYTQAWFRDPAASFGVGLSNALQIRFCP
jgi:hypothetical protein